MCAYLCVSVCESQPEPNDEPNDARIIQDGYYYYYYEYYETRHTFLIKDQLEDYRRIENVAGWLAVADYGWLWLKSKTVSNNI